jgi:hypothetical protein
VDTENTSKIFQREGSKIFVCYLQEKCFMFAKTD